MSNLKIDINKIILVIFVILVVMPSTISFLGISVYKIVCIFSIIIFGYLLIKGKVEKAILRNMFLITNILLSIYILFTFLFMENAKMNDYLEIIRFVSMAFITVDIIIICKEKKYFLFFLKLLCIASTFMAVFGIIQYFNPFHINEKYVHIYAPTQYRTLVNNYASPRIVSTKPNPAVYGFVSALGIYLQFMYFKHYKHKWIGIISILLIGISLLMTLSRTTQIAFLFSIIVYSFIKAKIKKGWIKAILILMIEIILIFTIFKILPNELTWRLEQMIDFENISSWNDRVDKWKEYEKIIDKNFLIGIGPVKNLVDELGYIDSELIQVMLQYGLIGFGIYILVISSPLSFIRKNKYNKHIYIYYIPIVFLILITNISSVTFLSSDTSILLYIIIGIILSNRENFI